MLRSILAVLFAAGLAACSSQAPAQSVPLQGGPWTIAHAPMYANSGNSQPVIQDSGPAGGGAVGLGISEGLYVARGTGVPPFVGQGTGPLGTNWCDYDAPTSNATGYHYFCLSANVNSGGLLAYGAGGAASQLPLRMNLNGTSYEFPFVLSGVVGPISSTVGHIALWNNTSGTLLSDSSSIPSAITATTQALRDNSTKIATTAYVDRSTASVYQAANFGVVCDGTTDNTSTWATAIAALPSTGAVLWAPPGTCIGTVVINKAMILQGQGWSDSGNTGTCGTEIRSTGAADNVILISHAGAQVRDLCVTNSVVAASRSGAGIKITAGPNVLISRVISNRHLYGIWNQAGGNEFEHVFTAFNKSYGELHDGSITNVNETGIYYAQSNANLADAGIGITGGSSAGIFMVRPTAVGNTGAGILLSGTQNDVHIVEPELSSNSSNQFDATNNAAGNLTIVGGIIEVDVGGGVAIKTGTAQQFVTITGNALTSTTGVLEINGAISTITGNNINGTGANSMVLYGAAASNLTITGNMITGSGSGTGITLTAGSAGCMIGTNYFLSVSTTITDGTAACTFAQVTLVKPTYP